jgi:hypothetical protein
MDNERNASEHEKDRHPVPGHTGDAKGEAPASENNTDQASPQDQPERLTFVQKMFFLLVIVFALFLLYMKLFLEKKMNTNTMDPNTYPAFSFSPPEGTWDYPAGNPDANPYEPNPDEMPFEPPADTYGPETPERGD